MKAKAIRAWNVLTSAIVGTTDTLNVDCIVGVLAKGVTFYHPRAIIFRGASETGKSTLLYLIGGLLEEAGADVERYGELIICNNCYIMTANGSGWFDLPNSLRELLPENFYHVKIIDMYGEHVSLDEYARFMMDNILEDKQSVVEYCANSYSVAVCSDEVFGKTILL